MILHRLKPEGKRLLTPELLGGELERHREETYAQLVAPHWRKIDLSALDTAIDGVLTRCRPRDAAFDRMLAADLHLSLPLTRREAADPALWRFLTVVHRPDAVRHRFDDRSGSAMRSRFWEAGARPDSNLLSRLWWIAELTRDGPDYALTQAALMREPLSESVFSRAWSGHRPAVEAAVEVLAGAPSYEIEQTARLLTKHLSTVVLEVLERDPLIELLGVLRDQVRAAEPE